MKEEAGVSNPNREAQFAGEWAPRHNKTTAQCLIGASPGTAVLETNECSHVVSCGANPHVLASRAVACDFDAAHVALVIVHLHELGRKRRSTSIRTRASDPEHQTLSMTCIQNWLVHRKNCRHGSAPCPLGCQTHHLPLRRVEAERDAHGLHHLDLLGGHVRRQVDASALLRLLLALLSLALGLGAALLVAAGRGPLLTVLLVPSLPVLAMIVILIPGKNQRENSLPSGKNDTTHIKHTQ